MLIDIHAHAFRLRNPKHSMCNLAELLAAQDRLGIDVSVVLPIVSPEIYFPQNTQDIIEMANAYPTRIIPFCNVDPRAMSNCPNADLVMPLQFYKDLGCRGVGEIMPQMEMKDPKVQNLFRAAQTVGLPVTCDGSDQLTGGFGLYDDPGLPQLELTLQRFPNLIMLGHGPIFWAEIARLETPGERCVAWSFEGKQLWRQGLHNKGPIKEEGVMPKLLRRYPNLHCDLSDGTAYNALTRDEDYIVEFIREFEDRMYFGTDIVSPDFEVPLIGTLKRWLDRGMITKTAYNKITHENAMKLLGLKDADLK